jgi:hypothetical protein
MTLATTTLSRALADCMEFLREGESMEACLERYPEYRERLRPLLEIAEALQGEQPEVAPSPHFLIELKSKLTREQQHEGR